MGTDLYYHAQAAKSRQMYVTITGNVNNNATMWLYSGVVLDKFG